MRLRTATLFSPFVIALLAEACGSDSVRPSEPAKTPVPTAKALSPLTQEGTVNQLVGFKPTILVTDAGGLPVAGINVSFTADAAPLALVTTGADGIASTDWKLSIVAVPQQLVATLYSAKMAALGPYVTFTAIAHPDSLAGIHVYSFPAQAGFSSSSVMIPPVIVAVDQYSNAKPGVQLTFEATGGGVATPASATTDSAGRASVGSWTLGSAVGTDTLIARVQGAGATAAPPLYVTTPVVEPFVVSSIVSGYQHTCALSQGDVYCWGQNGVGQAIPNDPGSATVVPHLVPLGVKAVSLASGYNHTCAISNESPPQAYCWGDNSTGQLGVLTPGHGPFRVPVAGGLASVATGAQHTCGLTPGGVAYCWGDGTDGQLGNGGIFTCIVTDGSAKDCPGPQAVKGDLHFASITAGVGHTCGIVGDGTLYCWGLNDVGQLGSNSTSPCVAYDYYYGYGTYAVPCALAPQPVPNAPAFATVAAGYATCAVATDGGVWCFRSSFGGRERLSSTRTVATISPDGSCALGAGGDAFCWLAGFDVPAASLEQPANLFSGIAFSAITSAQRHRCGILKGNGAAVCWGNDDVGQLGNGVTGGGRVPVPVGRP